MNAAPDPTDLKPGRYRMTAEVEIDEYGVIRPHDTAQMFLVDWWRKRGASVITTDAYAAILAGRRNRVAEHGQLRARVQVLQAEVNRLNALLDEHDAIQRAHRCNPGNPYASLDENADMPQRYVDVHLPEPTEEPA